MKHNSKRRPRCPKCGNKGKMVFREWWRDHVIETEQYADGTLADSSNQKEGSPYAVSAECGDCGHDWTLRGVTQILDIAVFREAAEEGFR